MLEGLGLDLEHLTDADREALRRKVVAPLWASGNLRFKLDDTQLRILDALNASSERKFYLLCSRRLGKSYTLVVLSMAMCLSRPRTRVLYLAPWGTDAADIATDIAETLLEDCPPHLKPHYDSQKKLYTFKNGSTIQFKGTNGEHAKYLRGGKAHLVVLDECGIMDDLDHVVNDVAMPMALTTGGRIILATTPPRTPGHPSAAIYEDLSARGASVKFTLNDNHRVPDSIKAEFLLEAGENPRDVEAILAGKMLPRTTTALREYWCEFVTDAESAVLPEFNHESKGEIVVAPAIPDYFDAYVFMDPGMKDKTGVLFGYWDFVRGKLVIQKDLVLSQASTLTIADNIRATERALWGSKEPYKRVSDVDLRLIKDLQTLHGLRFVPANKRDAIGQINRLRTMFQRRQIEILPTCLHTIRQCENAIWNNKGTDFARDGERGLDGHYDLVAALKYGAEAVDPHHNPFPAHYRIRHPDTHYSQKGQEVEGFSILPSTPLGQRLKNKFRLRNRLR